MADLLHFPSTITAERRAQPDALPDEAARANALDTRASWIVEAPAGSGKTGLLMQRYLKLLADSATTQPEEVLAITFTRKATAELRTRVLEQLEAAHTNAPLKNENSAFDRTTRELAEAVLARDMQLGWGLLDMPTKLRVRTIDSLCAEIAGTLPLLSGGGAERRPVEDAMPLYRLAARRTLMHLGGPDTALHTALQTFLLHRDANLGDCELLLARMLQTREQWAELVPLERRSLDDETLEREVRPRLERALENIVCSGLTRALNAVPRHVLYELTTLASRLGLAPGHGGKDSPIAFCADRNVPPEAKAEHLDHWVALICLLMKKSDCDWRKRFEARDLGFDIDKTDRALLKTLVEEIKTPELQATLASVLALPPARYPNDQWHVAKALFRLLLHALAELKVLFAERAECDFAELALAARDALHTDEGAADLASASGATLRHLLVDEMQDTSSAQYELLHLLTRSWDGHGQTLFLVGDPKQSIYLFRQARVERFLRTMAQGRLGDVSLGALRLTANFRSRPGLVEGFNHDFSRIFPTPHERNTLASETGDVPFVAASAVRDHATSGSILLHAAVIDNSGDTPDARAKAKRDHVREEAEHVRGIIEAWRSRPLPEDRKTPWRIAVLVRARNHLGPIVAELQRKDAEQAPIPFRAVNVEALNERTEVLDVFALTRAMLHPADRVAWLAMLHAPWCGLGLADLLALTGEGAAVSAETARQVNVPTLVTTRAHHLSPEGQALLHRAWSVLEAALAQSSRGDFAALVERTWRSLGGDVSLRPGELANVQRYLALLRDLQRTDRIDLRTLTTQISKLYAAPGTAEDAVDLMTIHTAKGLEWDVVIVPALEKRGQTSRGELLNWLELDAADNGSPSVVLAPVQRKGDSATDLSRWLRRMRDAREKAERKRLLYVACTRAREELHLFAACEHNAKGELKPALGTLLESYWPVAEKHFADTPANSPRTFPSQLAGAFIEEETLALAAAAAPEEAEEDFLQPALLQRLPLAFDPTERFREAALHRLPYTPASALRHGPEFKRPEGSFAVRAFGNVVHRYLQVLADRIATNNDADALLAELPTWHSRLHASLRGEGLPPSVCTREASRALQALTSTLSDPVGRWLLLPHNAAGSESALSLAEEGISTLRVDRTFVAGPTPLSSGEDALWIIDFKTTEQGSRSPELFAAEECAKYGPQLARYADVLRGADGNSKTIMLGLYYPLVPRLIHWPA